MSKPRIRYFITRDDEILSILRPIPIAFQGDGCMARASQIICMGLGTWEELWIGNVSDVKRRPVCDECVKELLPEYEKRVKKNG